MKKKEKKIVRPAKAPLLAEDLPLAGAADSLASPGNEAVPFYGKNDDEPLPRIAEAGKRILDQARQALPLSERPGRASRKVRRFGTPVNAMFAALGEHERQTLVEIPDTGDRALLCMSLETALRQGLPVRMTAVALRTADNKLALHRRRDPRLGRTGVWDLYTGFVMVGEAREDAATRLLATEAGLSEIRVVRLCGGNPLFALFVADLPAGALAVDPSGEERLTVDADELEGLVRDVPDLLSAELTAVATVPGLFRS